MTTHAWDSTGARYPSLTDPVVLVTERQIKLRLMPEAEREQLEQQTIKRRQVPADIARMALFAACDDASGITGQSFVVDEGCV